MQFSPMVQYKTLARWHYENMEENQNIKGLEIKTRLVISYARKTMFKQAPNLVKNTVLINQFTSYDKLIHLRQAVVCSNSLRVFS